MQTEKVAVNRQGTTQWNKDTHKKVISTRKIGREREREKKKKKTTVLFFHILFVI